MNTTNTNAAAAIVIEPAFREIKTESDRLFASVFTAAEPIEYNPEWANGTGYFDGITSMENRFLVPAGEVRRCTDEAGRRMIIVGTFFGPAVCFDRFGPKSDHSVYVQNVSNQLRACGLVTGSSNLSYAEMMEIIGSEYNVQYGNVGQRVAKLRKAFELYEGVDAKKIQATSRM